MDEMEEEETELKKRREWNDIEDFSKIRKAVSFWKKGSQKREFMKKQGEESIAKERRISIF